MATTRHLCVACILGVLSLIPSPAGAATIDIIVSADGGAIFWSFGDEFSDSNPSIRIGNSSSVPAASHTAAGVFEFDLRGLSGITIQEAFFLAVVTTGSAVGGLRLSAYAGNGIAEIADAGHRDLLVGTSGPLPPVVPPQTLPLAIPLSATVVQDLLGGYLGLTGYCCADSGLNIASLENSLGLTPPTLRLVTSEPPSIPEPATALLVASGLAIGAIRGHRVRRSGGRQRVADSN